MSKSRFQQEIRQSWERFRQLSPLVQWASYAAVVLIVLLGWNDYIRPKVNDLNAQARSYEERIERLRRADTLAGQIHLLNETIRAVGEVQPPRTASEGEAALHTAINELTSRYGASNVTFNMRPGGTLPRGALSELTGGAQAERLTARVNFEAAPDDAMAIIAGLESRPEIETITSAHLTRASGRRLSVVLNVEVWVLPQDRTTARGTGV
jgi:hypothetical protein